ncbi:MAG TPA: tetratricopeptide repeat protein [Lysobacter sp.]|nr:tetratricopeptide repeat protein [Lysobacter sp.]
MSRLGALLLCIALGLGSAHAAPPEHLRPGERPAPGTTEAELWYGMDQAEKEIRQSPYIVRDPSLNAYVREVLCKVTREYCKDLRLYIVDLPVFNASMAPNGVTLVFTGALLRMRDEAELAVVLGHEFAHYRARHSLEGWTSAKRTSALLSTIGLVTLGAGVPIAGDLALLAGMSGLFKQSRDNEREADRLGFQTAVAGGYDPHAGVRLWERLRREERADRTHKNRAVFASHPQTDERVADIRAAAVSLGTEGRREQDAFRAAMRPFQQHWLEGELSRRTYDTTVQVIGELRQDAPRELTALYAYYLGEAHRRRAKGDDLARAAALYAEAIALPDPPPAAWREHGLALQKQGDRAAAAQALRRYLDVAPDAKDAALVRHYISQLESTR